MKWSISTWPKRTWTFKSTTIEYNMQWAVQYEQPFFMLYNRELAQNTLKFSFIPTRCFPALKIVFHISCIKMCINYTCCKVKERFHMQLMKNYYYTITTSMYDENPNHQYRNNRSHSCGTGKFKDLE